MAALWILCSPVESSGVDATARRETQGAGVSSRKSGVPEWKPPPADWLPPPPTNRPEPRLAPKEAPSGREAFKARVRRPQATPPTEDRWPYGALPVVGVAMFLLFSIALLCIVAAFVVAARQGHRPAQRNSCEITIGRHRTNDYMLSDKRVSRYHAVLRHQGGLWILQDLNSDNGVEIGGVKTAEGVVTPETPLKIGGVPVSARKLVRKAESILQARRLNSEAKFSGHSQR